MTASSSSLAAVDSPKLLYKQKCSELALHCNTQVFRDLPSDVTSLDDVVLLDFSRNCLGRNGLKPLLLILRLVPNLEAINLSENYLTNAAVMELVTLLETDKQCCRKLAHLDLSKNPISNPTGKLLSALVDKMPSLRRVVLKGTLMNPGLARLIDAKLAKRTPVDRSSSMAALQQQQQQYSTVGRMEGLRAAGDVLERRSSEQQPAVASSSSSSKTGASQQQQQSAVAPQHASLDAASPDGACEGAATAGAAATIPAGGASPVSSKPRSKGDGGEDWSAMETIWNLAAVAAPPADGWTGLASVMALVRQDASIAAMY